MVHNLLSAYGLDKDFAVVEPDPAAEDDLRLFHSSEYVDYLKMHQCDGEVSVDDLSQTNVDFDASEEDEDDEEDDGEELNHEEYGIGNY